MFSSSHSHSTLIVIQHNSSLRFAQSAHPVPPVVSGSCRRLIVLHYFRQDLHSISICSTRFFFLFFVYRRPLFPFFMSTSSSVLVVGLCFNFCRILVIHLLLLAFFLASSSSCSRVYVFSVTGSLLLQPLFLYVQVYSSSTGFAC